jgi:hypothetical protein
MEMRQIDMDAAHSFESKAASLRAPESATDLLKNLKPRDIRLDSLDKETQEPMFWRSICSEHDARHFYRHLLESRISLPWQFEDFLPRWLADEVNHARAFKILYRSIYGTSFDEIESALRKRAIDFSPVQEFFDDLQSLCLLFAYDELVTTQVYRRSIPFYEALGFVSSGKWARRLVFDEAQHFSAVMNVLMQYCDRDADRAEATLMRIIDVDLQQEEYGGTFVLDHSCPEFPFGRAELVSMSRKAILRKLTAGNGSSALREI